MKDYFYVDRDKPRTGRYMSQLMSKTMVLQDLSSEVEKGRDINDFTMYFASAIPIEVKAVVQTKEMEEE